MVSGTACNRAMSTVAPHDMVHSYMVHSVTENGRTLKFTSQGFEEE